MYDLIFTEKYNVRQKSDVRIEQTSLSQLERETIEMSEIYGTNPLNGEYPLSIGKSLPKPMSTHIPYAILESNYRSSRQC